MHRLSSAASRASKLTPQSIRTTDDRRRRPRPTQASPSKASGDAKGRKGLGYFDGFR